MSIKDDITLFKDDSKLYVTDFKYGRFISKTFTSDELPREGNFGISPKISVRLSYIKKKEDIVGIELKKIGAKENQRLSLSAYDTRMLLKTLQLFANVDLKSIGNKSIVLDETILKAGDTERIRQFLSTLAADPNGRDIIKSLDNITPSFLQVGLFRKTNTETFNRLLNDPEYFTNIKKNLNIGKDEEVWQKFFTENDWILGSDAIRILESRMLDEHNVMDIPIKNYDGFLDIVELKLPSAQFWNNNMTPAATLTAAIMQCARYLRVAEKESNSYDRLEELGCKIIKPRITLIYGRSVGWSTEQKEQFRILNSTLSNITILTYDHLLLRAKRIAGLPN